MRQHLDLFLQGLRNGGVPVTNATRIEVARMLEVISIEDRRVFKAALQSATCRSSLDISVFENLFPLIFGFETSSPVTYAELGDTEFIEFLFQLLEDAQIPETSLRGLASEAIRRFSGWVPGATFGEGFLVFQTERALGIDGPRHFLHPPQSSNGGLEETIHANMLNGHRNRFRKALQAEARSFSLLERNAEERLRVGRKVPLQEVEFQRATRAELLEMRKVVKPLARHLAFQMSRSRRLGHRGNLDMRRVMRESLSTGGVPVELQFHKRSKRKAHVVVLGDVSGSVANFARFTMQFLDALGSEIRVAHLFAFVDGVARYETGRSIEDLGIVQNDGHSNYGKVFEEFSNTYSHLLRADTTLLILGDARNNYHGSGERAFAKLCSAAKQTFWLNPEDKNFWNTGDSLASVYQHYANAMFECRTTSQLAKFASLLR